MQTRLPRRPPRRPRVRLERPSRRQKPLCSSRRASRRAAAGGSCCWRGWWMWRRQWGVAQRLSGEVALPREAGL